MVALDGSEPSMDAVDNAIYIARKNGADLTALYVVSSPTVADYTSDMPEDQIPETVKKVVQNSKQESQPWFNKVSEKVTAAATAIVKEDTKKTTRTIQLKTEVIVSPLSVIGSIVEYAERESIDLIVIGTRGRSGFKRLLLGSTALGVVTHAHCPVMVVK